MFKRNTAIFFILTAYIFLLVHAVIPHHHHDSNVCIISSHCETGTEDHDHNTTEHNHNHDGDNKTENCVLNQEVVIPSNQVRQSCKCIDCIDSHHESDQLQAVLFDSKTKSFAAKCFYVIKRPLTASVYSLYLSSGLNLRAPPVV